jgi:apolipoprotein N-acyltransferase
VGRIGSLICFDSIYEQLSLDSVRDGAQLLAVSTNDSWFFDSAAARMHNAQAQLRAAETGRCIIRAANTGISSVISSRGELLSTLPALQDGVLTASITQGDHVTLYTRIGNLFVYLCMSYSVGLVLCEVLSRRKNKRTTE